MRGVFFMGRAEELLLSFRCVVTDPGFSLRAASGHSCTDGNTTEQMNHIYAQ